MEYDSESSCDDRLRDANNPQNPQNRAGPNDRYVRASIATSWRCIDVVDSSAKLKPDVAGKSLSAQVMEYYHKYSQSSNLEQYFSLPTASNYYCSVYETPKLTAEEKANCIAQNYSLSTPKERRRWVRPPLIGESVSVESATYTSKSHSPESKIIEDKNESQDFDKKPVSPTSSVTSHKPLEWDSLADVGYCNFGPYNKSCNSKLSTIERMVLNTGCSSALRLDPEGTEPTSCQKISKPKANSTLLSKNISESENEVEITPIVKNHFDHKTIETPTFKVPPAVIKTQKDKEPALKKSPSMNLITPSTSKAPLKRSQSDLNLCAKDKHKILPRLIFNSTSSIATVVNKVTCDKVIQTSVDNDYKVKSESIGIQVAVSDEEKLPKSTHKSLQSILKSSSKNTYKVRAKSKSRGEKENNESSHKKQERKYHSSATSVDSTASTPRPDDTAENVADRANSFEYFPGPVYENEKTSSRISSRVSSVDTANSHSTVPNTSSSLEEKLWGQSDSLLRDLEKSLKILQSLVSANKCDKQTRQRFIHHVVTRLVSANYTDDKIEHKLDENVPWNPDEARKKVYRTEMIHNLAKKTNTTDSSEDWKPRVRKRESKKSEKEKIINLESSSDKFDRNTTDRTETDGRKARMGLRTDDDCYHNKSESSECFIPPRSFAKVNKMKGMYGMKGKGERKDSTSNSTSSQGASPLLDEIISKSSSHEPGWKSGSESTSEAQFSKEKKSNVGSDSESANLINYAEMEKKNQLVWITNEISHLLNLKKLLEQPKKSSTPKASPSKSRHSNFKQKNDAAMQFQNDYKSPEKHNRVTSSAFEHPLHKQWSSHCDLTTCEPMASSSLKSVKCLRKRNSYTQTSESVESSHSKSGAEIISAQKVSTQYVKITNCSVQTSPRIIKVGSKVAHTACQTSYVQVNPSLTSCACYEKRPIISQPVTLLCPENHCHLKCSCKSDEHLKLKETKNHLNSNKLKKSSEQCCHCEMRKVCLCDSYSSNSNLEKDDYDKESCSSWKCCSACGVTYRKDRTCGCQINYPKPIAYEIKFDGDNKKESSKMKKKSSQRSVTNSCACNSVQTKEDHTRKDTLRDHLSYNKPKFVDNIETRQKYIMEISHLRQLKKEKRLQLLAMSNKASLFKSFNPVKKTKYTQKKYSEEKLRELSRQRYYRLNEVRAKRKQKEKEEALRHNKLMAHLFCKKLQQKVLRGQVDLSQSTSVISNL